MKAICSDLESLIGNETVLWSGQTEPDYVARVKKQQRSRHRLIAGVLTLIPVLFIFLAPLIPDSQDYWPNVGTAALVVGVCCGTTAGAVWVIFHFGRFLRAELVENATYAVTPTRCIQLNHANSATKVLEFNESEGIVTVTIRRLSEHGGHVVLTEFGDEIAAQRFVFGYMKDPRFLQNLVQERLKAARRKRTLKGIFP